jgi:poly(A) polymerase
MEPVIIPREDHPISRQDISPEALQVLYRLKEMGFHGYLAGGCVRDLLIGRKPKDFDVVTDAQPNRVKSMFRWARIIGRRFRLVHVCFPENKVIEVATFRSNQPADDSPHVVKGREGQILRDNQYGSPEEDALRRDFTVNALFYDISTFSIIDYASAMTDIRDKVLRCIGDPDTRYREDPVRMIRAIRFAAQCGFTVELNTWQGLLRQRDQISLAAPARLYEEMLKYFNSGSMEAVLPLLEESGLIDILFPSWARWWRSDSGPEDHAWVRAACKTLDRFRAHGRVAPPALQWALFFGSFLLHRARVAQEEGAHPVDAIHDALTGFYNETVTRLAIPKRTMLHLQHILTTQIRMATPDEATAERIWGRYYVQDALVFYKFSNNIKGGGFAETLAWWEAWYRANPPPAELINEDDEENPRRRRPRRRRRGDRNAAIDEENRDIAGQGEAEPPAYEREDGEESAEGEGDDADEGDDRESDDNRDEDRGGR